MLKADIRHYFDTVDHKILLSILMKKIADKKIRWLMRLILSNYHSGVDEKGMPLGNLTSQFFANVYLNELDQFVKQQLKVKYYLRYVDDFIILHHSPLVLEGYKQKINDFLLQKLALNLHPDKSKIIFLLRGVHFLGFKVFLHHKLIKKKNILHFYRKEADIYSQYSRKEIDYEDVYNFMEGWVAYIKNANTFTVRRRILSKFEVKYPQEISMKEVNRYLNEERKSIQKMIAEMKKKKQAKLNPISPTPTVSPPQSPLQPPARSSPIFPIPPDESRR